MTKPYIAVLDKFALSALLNTDPQKITSHHLARFSRVNQIDRVCYIGTERFFYFRFVGAGKNGGNTCFGIIVGKDSKLGKGKYNV